LKGFTCWLLIELKGRMKYEYSVQNQSLKLLQKSLGNDPDF
jgi:hypothetical protein